MSNKYQYDELRAAAINPSAAQEDINALGEWFDAYGANFWNGEYYDADGYKVVPVVEWDDETETGKTIGYEIERA